MLLHTRNVVVQTVYILLGRKANIRTLELLCGRHHG
jgi:hypothetical protein